MKKKILLVSIFLTFIIIALLQTNVFAATHTLDEIAEKFNNCSSVKSYQSYGYEYTATVNKEEPNTLYITSKNPKNESSTVSYELNGSILSYEHLVQENLFSAMILADCVGQVNGYKDGELFDSLNSEEIHKYTVKKEGFEIKENGSYYSIKMDINKKIPLVDFSNFYLKPDDFSTIKEFIDAGEKGNQNGKRIKMVYDLILGDDENYIYIGEEEKTTKSTYKSILSALEVMYGEKVVKYFKSIYPDFSEGNVEVDGFSVDTDVEMDSEEHPIFEGTKVVLVTIDNKYISDEILRTKYIGETVNHGDKNITLDFTKNKSYKLGFFDSVSSSDAAFLYKYVLEPVFEESKAKINDNTAYFKIADGKIAVGNKKDSIFKVVIKDDCLEILPTKADVEKTSEKAKHKNLKAKEYEEGKSQEHFRYGKYNVTVNIIYGKEVKEKKASTISNNVKKEVITTNNPKTGDNVEIYLTLFAISFVGIIIIGIRVRKLK